MPECTPMSQACLVLSDAPSRKVQMLCLGSDPAYRT